MSVYVCIQMRVKIRPIYIAECLIMGPKKSMRANR